MIQYKGYVGKIEVDADADLIHGEVLGIRDVVTFQGRTPGEAAKAFRDSVNDYLAFCAKRNEEPDKPFSGKFVVRVDPTLHRFVSAVAEATGMSLNAWINDRLASEVASELDEVGRVKRKPAKTSKRFFSQKNPQRNGK